MVSKKYTYGVALKLPRAFFFLLSTILFVFGLLYLIKLLSVLAGQETIFSLPPAHLFWSFVEFSIWSPFAFAFISYLATDIEVEEDGLRIKFIFKSFFIGWDDIEDFKPGKILGLLNLKRVRVLVTKNALTPFHRVYGLMYGGTTKPSLLIGTNISNHEELFKIIKNNRKKK
ncbi:MAG: hypothetical protein ABI904_17905 [Chloroflexota bacterium]